MHKTFWLTWQTTDGRTGGVVKRSHANDNTRCEKRKWTWASVLIWLDFTFWKWELMVSDFDVLQATRAELVAPLLQKCLVLTPELYFKKIRYVCSFILFVLLAMHTWVQLFLWINVGHWWCSAAAKFAAVHRKQWGDFDLYFELYFFLDLRSCFYVKTPWVLLKGNM